MVRVNRKYFDKGLKAQSWARFFNIVRESHSPADLFGKLGRFLTPAEIIMLEKRLCIPILLERNQSYRAIGRAIDVSPATISFVKHNLTKKPVVHRQYSSDPKPGKKKHLKYPVQAWAWDKINGNN